MPATDPTTTIRTLVAAIPNDRLIDLLLDLLSRALPARAAAAPAPTRGAGGARRRRGDLVDGARKRIVTARPLAAFELSAAYARQKRANGNTNDRNGSATAFWDHADKLNLPARGCRHAGIRYEGAGRAELLRKQRLPPRVGPMADRKVPDPGGGTRDDR